MLYEELLRLTDYGATYEEYKSVEKIYMTSGSMTKPQAAELWKKTYGPETFKSKIALASRLGHQKMLKVWQSIYDAKSFDIEDIETGLRFTLINWHHPRLDKNVLTLAVLLKKGGKNANHYIMPLPMTEVGENCPAFWRGPNDIIIRIIRP